MEYIAAKIGGQIFYVDQDKIAAIVENPVIFKVPGADERIAGISLHDGRLAVYIYLEEKHECQCGIMLDTGKKILYGITAEDVGVEGIDPALLDTVMMGVWVMKGD